MTAMMKHFRIILADEILFTIAYEKPHLPAEELCEEFENRVDCELGHFVEMDERDFVRSSPRLSVVRFSTPGQNNPTLGYMAKPTLHEHTTDNQYRQMLLIRIAKLIERNGLCENSGNSTLHFLVALPGRSTENLVEILLKAEVDPLAVNTRSQNILHVIAGRMRAEENGNGYLVFRHGKNNSTQWKAEDRKAILHVLSEKLSDAELSTLATDQDEYGDTAMHEWALSASTIGCRHSVCSCVEDELDIASRLLEFGARLRLPNNSGNVPLHYAFDFHAFDFLFARCDVCRVRNDHDEPPLMFMVKRIVMEALSPLGIDEFPQLSTTFLKTARGKPIRVDKLTHVLELLEEFAEVRATIWTRDINGNSVFDIILWSIRIVSYDFFQHPRFNSLNSLSLLENLLKEMNVTYLRNDLVSLLKEVMSMQRPDAMVQPNPLHTLLKVRPEVQSLKCNNTPILKSLEVVLEQGVEVNAVNADGLTPLDIANKQASLNKEIIDKLVTYGARRSSHSYKRQLKSTCPRSHHPNAMALVTAQTTSNVTVEGNYRYFNDKPIGVGAFSSVFLAIKDEHKDDRSGTISCSLVALKRIENTKVNPNEISSEVKTLISLPSKCENIVRYHGVEHSQDGLFQYLCLELMEGDLQQFVANTSNSSLKTDGSLMKAAHDIVNGVAQLHNENFVHRDLKPGNILYTTHPSLQFKIADFGLAKNLSTSYAAMSSSVSGVVMAPGTRCWMAPELISMPSREHTMESDIFSLGLVLHYLLTRGRHPFVGVIEEAPHVIERKIVETQLRLQPSLHPEASGFLHSLLAKDPKRRTPAKFFHQHPFLWSERKKIEFLKAVGDQQEAVTPKAFQNSKLQRGLQSTTVGRRVTLQSWNRSFQEMFEEVTTVWKEKKYRTDQVIDLIRFIRNAYAHKQERTPQTQEELEKNIFLQTYPSLVLDVFGVVQQLKYDETRTNIRDALKLESGTQLSSWNRNAGSNFSTPARTVVFK